MNDFFIQKRPRILGVFAHPDETFCAGGTFPCCSYNVDKTPEEEKERMRRTINMLHNKR